MYKNATVSVYPEIQTRNTDGDFITSWGYLEDPVVAASETLRCDVQPRRLRESELKAFGISEEKADAKIAFFRRSVYIADGARAYVVSDFPGEPAKYFDIKTPSRWPGHGEAILIPVQGE